MEREFTRFGVETTFVDTSELEHVQKALRPILKEAGPAPETPV